MTSAAFILCLGSVSGVWLQHQELSRLRTQQVRAANAARTDAEHSPTAAATNSGGTDELLPEVLRLRSEITRLSARKRELAGVPGEMERLRAQLAAGDTNAPPGARLPAGYMRKAEAQMVGYSTPENTLQSLLWSIQRHDVASFLQALTPDQAQRIRSQIETGAKGEDFFEGADALPGLAIEARRNLPDGSVELGVSVAPGLPPETLRLHPINGEWKLDQMP